MGGASATAPLPDAACPARNRATSSAFLPDTMRPRSANRRFSCCTVKRSISSPSSPSLASVAASATATASSCASAASMAACCCSSSSARRRRASSAFLRACSRTSAAWRRFSTIAGSTFFFFALAITRAPLPPRDWAVRPTLRVSWHRCAMYSWDSSAHLANLPSHGGDGWGSWRNALGRTAAVARPKTEAATTRATAATADTRSPRGRRPSGMGGMSRRARLSTRRRYHATNKPGRR
mmetsp:Transcript_85641/g.239221  ORF Transcript_85641/g.239221 Transcript_85641/m.239221 type:complete len:238 (-) Transcript_85641:47-760(-)